MKRGAVGRLGLATGSPSEERAAAISLAISAVRLVLGTVYFAAGLSKIVGGFPAIIGPVWLEEALAPHGLAAFARFVAISEVVVGAMLLTRRFASVGAIALVPVQVGILATVVSLGWHGTPLIMAILIMLNGFLVALDYSRWKYLFFDDSALPDAEPLRRSRMSLDVVWLMSCVVLVSCLAAFPESVFVGLGVLAACLALAGVGVVDWWESRLS